MRTRLITLTILLAVLAPAVPDAQGRGTGQPPGGGRAQRPPRDVVQRPAERTGTASISGRILSADTNLPIKRARILVSLSGGGRPRAMVTDESGRYQVGALAAGTYTITATKAGFVDSAFGQRRALRNGTPIQLADGQQLANIDLVLARGAVISGHVLDEDGEPLARTTVQVLRSQYQRGERRLVPTGGDQSDDRGQYRVFGLPPGDYLVSATAPFDRFLRRAMIAPAPESIGFDAGATTATGYAPTYYPGVITPADAARVRVAAGQEMNGIDFQLQLVPLATVRGATSDPRGVVSLVPADGVGPMRGQGLRAPVQQDGTFAIPNVPPGKYVAVARTEGAAGPATVAMQNVIVSGNDVVITLTPVRGSRLGGTVTFESATTRPPATFERIRITAQPMGAARLLPGLRRPAEVDDAGQFIFSDLLPGQYVIQATGTRGWTMKAVYLDGRDVTDEPVDIKGGDNSTGLNVVFSDRISGLSGVVGGSGDAPAAGTTVIAFPSDEKRWRPQTRRIQTARADQNGAYRFNNLPPGEYLLVATDDVEQGEWFDPAFLASVRDKGLRITLAEGEEKVQTLKAS